MTKKTIPDTRREWSPPLSTRLVVLGAIWLVVAWALLGQPESPPPRTERSTTGTLRAIIAEPIIAVCGVPVRLVRPLVAAMLALTPQPTP